MYFVVLVSHGYPGRFEPYYKQHGVVGKAVDEATSGC
jgi:hypothetical protein